MLLPADDSCWLQQLLMRLPTTTDADYSIAACRLVWDDDALTTPSM